MQVVLHDHFHENGQLKNINNYNYYGDVHTAICPKDKVPFLAFLLQIQQGSISHYYRAHFCQINKNGQSYWTCGRTFVL